MTKEQNQKAFIFPGQGSQYIGMGKDFYEKYPVCKEVFQQADEILHFGLSKLIFSGSLQELTLTKHAQPAIFVTSIALLRALQKELPQIKPQAAGGLSLGEYSALTAAEKIAFSDALVLVQKRAFLMHEACEKNKGTMAAVIGLEADRIEELLYPMQKDRVFAANFNTPGQTVISGSIEGVEKASAMLKEKGARKIVPLKVHGAFHSGLMQEAQTGLEKAIETTEFVNSPVRVVMNAEGGFVDGKEEMKKALVRQMTNPVRWQKCVEALDGFGTRLFIEIGPGKTLFNMNKKIKVQGETVNLEKISDLDVIYQEIMNNVAK